MCCPCRPRAAKCRNGSARPVACDSHGTSARAPKNHLVLPRCYPGSLSTLALACNPLKSWCRRSDSNRGPTDYESVALPLSYVGPPWPGIWPYTAPSVPPQLRSTGGSHFSGRPRPPLWRNKDPVHVGIRPEAGSLPYESVALREARPIARLHPRPGEREMTAEWRFRPLRIGHRRSLPCVAETEGPESRRSNGGTPLAAGCIPWLGASAPSFRRLWSPPITRDNRDLPCLIERIPKPLTLRWGNGPVAG